MIFLLFVLDFLACVPFILIYRLFFFVSSFSFSLFIYTALYLHFKKKIPLTWKKWTSLFWPSPLWREADIHQMKRYALVEWTASEHVSLKETVEPGMCSRVWQRATTAQLDFRRSPRMNRWQHRSYSSLGDTIRIAKDTQRGESSNDRVYDYYPFAMTYLSGDLWDQIVRRDDRLKTKLRLAGISSTNGNRRS